MKREREREEAVIAIKNCNVTLLPDADLKIKYSKYNNSIISIRFTMKVVFGKYFM